ncbi:unnamed protein product [Phytomonas sp. Hart1]|nr:unnamed protein product [Phytomonas sp. Hart1]|eukprot:CCW70753.1 unnamed protein product [Phytomonas sp. isolate Hart1]
MPSAQIRALCLEAEARPCVSAYRALVQAELRYLAARLTPGDGPDPQPPADDRKAQLRRFIETLKARQRPSAPEAPSSLPSSRPVISPGPAGREGRPGITAAACARYRAGWLSLLQEFTTRKVVLTRVLSYPNGEFKHVELGLVSHWLDTWGAFFREAEQLCRELKGVEREVGMPLALPPTRGLYNLLDDVCRLQLQARSLVGRERYRRSAANEDAIEDFLANHEQLTQWCGKQHGVLLELDAVDPLHDFCDRLRHNAPVMESNFMVLTEQADVLAGEDHVQAGLRRANRAWVGLCYGTYERLRAAVRREHRASAVEASCEKWVRELGPRVREVLSKANQFLHAQASESSSSSISSLAERCDELLLDHDAHHVICAHISDYDVREDCVQPHIDALKMELESDLTSMILSFSHVVDYEERAIYKNRIEELKEWIEVNSQKGTYMKLLERLEVTKEMIAEYADALFPDDAH